jgi:UDP-glucoronosyl and UDP-glucosyl transferase
LNFHRFYYYTEEIPLQNEIIKNVLNDKNAPDMWEIESSADLLLINSYEVLNNIRPSVPTTVYLGGIHQKLEKSPLSPSLAQFLDDSEHVVYVNLNSAVQQDPIRFGKLMSALERLNVDIVWSLDDDYVNSSARLFQGFNIDQDSILGELIKSFPLKALNRVKFEFTEA